MHTRVLLGASTPMPFVPERSAGGARWLTRVGGLFRRRCPQVRYRCSWLLKHPGPQKLPKGKRCAVPVVVKCEPRCDPQASYPSTIALGSQIRVCANHQGT